MKIAFFDTKPYDKHSFEKYANSDISFKFFETKLNIDTADLARGCDVVCIFVNDPAGVITSNPSFETWFLNHFMKTTKEQIVSAFDLHDSEEMGLIFALCMILICVSCYVMFLNIAMQLLFYMTGIFFSIDSYHNYRQVFIVTDCSLFYFKCPYVVFI